MPDSDPATAVVTKHHCSVIKDRTLYIYSEDGMQSLPLKEGGEWSDLPMGVAVTGGRCVLADSGSPQSAAMYVVGGSTNSSVKDYPGLQKYTFSSKRWETIEPQVQVTKNRQNHGAAYIKDSDSILVYAGSQDTAEPVLSSQTFLIGLKEPYNPQSFTSNGAPPLAAPMVMPWNDSHAIMMGGGADNRAIFVFGQDGWSDLGVSLEHGMADDNTMKCTVMSGDDGSKVLEVYDMSSSPNKVEQIALWTGHGPAQRGHFLGSSKSKKRKRDLTLDNWPAYNPKNAPDVTRTGFSLASDDESGLAVISGGASKQTIAIFDQEKNSWVDAAGLLGSQDPLRVGSTRASSSSSTSTASPSSIAPPTSSASSTSEPNEGLAPPGTTHSRTVTVLGATLGTIFGLAAVLIIVLLCLRHKREKKKREGGGFVNEKEQDRLSFADQGAEFMHTAGGSVGHNFTRSMNNSLTSLNIIAGKIDKSRSGHTRNGLGSDASTLALVNNQRTKPSPLGFGDPVEMSQMQASVPNPPNFAKAASRQQQAAVGDVATTSGPTSRGNEGRPDSRGSGTVSKGGAVVPGMGGAGIGANSRSSGWSKYFANDHSTTALGVRKGSVGSDRTSASMSQYTRGSGTTATYPSQTVQPLELNLGPKFGEGGVIDGRPVSRVATGSPAMGHSREHSADGRAHMQGQAAEIARAASGKSGKSTIDSGTWGDSTFDSHGGTATTNTWTPVSDHTGWNTSPPKAGPAQNHDSVASSIYSRNPQASYCPAYDDRRNLYYKSGRSSGVFPAPPKASLGEDNRDSSATMWPRGPDSPGLPSLPKQYVGAGYLGGGSGAPAPTGYAYNQGAAPQKKAPVTEDVSWLNLNAGSAY